ncbi:hypothetical protein [Microvirga sp. P5_D2]
MTNGHTRPHRRRLLDLSELHEASLIADLVFLGLDDAEPDPVEMALAPILTHWSVAPGPRLIGVDEWGGILILDVWSIGRCRTWAQTPDGLVRLRDRSRIPLAKEARR